MSRSPPRGRLKASALVSLRVITSPATPRNRGGHFLSFAQHSFIPYPGPHAAPFLPPPSTLDNPLHPMTPEEALRVLELNPPFTKLDLKKAYRESQMVWHPDRFQGNDALQSKAQKKAYLINEAFALLSSGLDESQTTQKQPQPERAAEPDPSHTQADSPQFQSGRSSSSASSDPSLEKKAAVIGRFVSYLRTKGCVFESFPKGSPRSELAKHCAVMGISKWGDLRIAIDGDGLADHEIVSRFPFIHRYGGNVNFVLIVFSKRVRAEAFRACSSRGCVVFDFFNKIYTKGWITDLESETIHSANHPINALDIGTRVLAFKLSKVIFKKG